MYKILTMIKCYLVTRTSKLERPYYPRCFPWPVTCTTCGILSSWSFFGEFICRTNHSKTNVRVPYFCCHVTQRKYLIVFTTRFLNLERTQRAGESVTQIGNSYVYASRFIRRSWLKLFEQSPTRHIQVLHVKGHSVDGDNEKADIMLVKKGGCKDTIWPNGSKGSQIWYYQVGLINNGKKT